MMSHNLIISFRKITSKSLCLHIFSIIPIHFKYRNGKSKSAQHPLDNRYAIGPMEEIMNVLRITKRGKIMNTLERFHLYNETKMDNQINN